ncbi:MAG TPA: SIS domain-containing protein [Candidatus Dormibacteraeota bacterium]
MTSAGRDAFSELLYPMLRDRAQASDEVLAQLALAPLQKSAETNRLRRQLIDEHEVEILGCARDLAAAFGRGARLLACGNGGSATTAADLAADLLHPGSGRRPLPALSLTNDVAVVTAVANDVSFDDVFVRQIIALGRRGDIVVVVSTSGGSENLVRALQVARRLEMLTVALAGYDGGRVAREASVDHLFVIPSSSVHRIQEVQTTLCHVLGELIQAQMEELACA